MKVNVKSTGKQSTKGAIQMPGWEQLHGSVLQFGVRP